MENRKGEVNNYQNTNNMHNYRQNNYNVNYKPNYNNHNTNNNSNLNNYNNQNNNRINQSINSNQNNNHNSNINQNVNRNININATNNQSNNRNVNNNYNVNIDQRNNNMINNNSGNLYPNNQVKNNYNNQYQNNNYSNPYQSNNYNSNYYQPNQYNSYGYNQGYNNNFNPNYNNYYGNMPNNNYQQSNYESKLNNISEEEKKNRKTKKKFNLGEKIDVKKIIIILLILAALVLIFVFAKNLLKSYDVKIYLNGADAVEEEMKCTSDYLGHCTLTLPSAQRNDGEVLGYSKIVDSRDAEYKIGQTIELEEDTVLFVISKKDNELKIDTSDIDELSVSSDELKCSTYNAENKCSITVPLFNKRGYENMGYSEKKGSDKITVHPGDKYQGGKTLYPVYVKWPNDKVYSVKDSFPLSNAYVDVESGCPADIVDAYTEYVKAIDEKWPFLFHGQKIVFHGEEAFYQFTGFGKTVGGATYTNSSMAPLTVKCIMPSSSTYDVYMVFVHELAHSFDMEYEKYFKKRISSESDIKSLYSKYKNYSTNRPLSLYAFVGTGAYDATIEFFAELMAYYYLNVVDTEYKLIEGKRYYRGNFPDDMKAVVEKYVCIGMNNFDKSKCS